MGPRQIMTTLEAIFAADLGRHCLVLDRDRPRNLGGPSDVERLSRLRQLKSLAHDGGALLGVTGRLDLALAAGVDAIQLPERGLDVDEVRQIAHRPLLVGRSCHDREGLQRAERTGADWATLSPVRTPWTKTASGSPLGVDGFRAMCTGIGLPVFALGGIGPDICARLKAAGAAGVATIGAVFAVEDPIRSVDALTGAWDRGRRPS
ncbi:MAG: thiamine-phosphate pyrophosphorylase [Myxococcota bacterium]|jgi:thiamine-phosphate pyrophosphorylase